MTKERKEQLNNIDDLRVFEDFVGVNLFEKIDEMISVCNGEKGLQNYKDVYVSFCEGFEEVDPRNQFISNFSTLDFKAGNPNAKKEINKLTEITIKFHLSDEVGQRIGKDMALSQKAEHIPMVRGMQVSWLDMSLDSDGEPK